MAIEFYISNQEIFKNCVGYWNLRGDTLPTIGTLNGVVTGATLDTDRFGLSSKSHAFNGSSQYITIGNVNASIKTVVLWIKLSNTSGGICKLTDTPHKVAVSTGTVSTSGWPTTVSIYVDSIVSSTLDTSWHMLTISTSGTAFTVSNLILGYDGSAYLIGNLGEVLLFSNQLSIEQITQLYRVMNKRSLNPIDFTRGVE